MIFCTKKYSLQVVNLIFVQCYDVDSKRIDLRIMCIHYIAIYNECMQ